MCQIANSSESPTSILCDIYIYIYIYVYIHIDVNTACTVHAHKATRENKKGIWKVYWVLWHGVWEIALIGCENTPLDTARFQFQFEYVFDWFGVFFLSPFLSPTLNQSHCSHICKEKRYALHIYVYIHVYMHEQQQQHTEHKIK